MKKLIALTIFIMAMAFGASAQTPQTDITANEYYVGYTFLRQDVKIERPSLKWNENTDSHGFIVGYTRYLEKKGNLGITAEAGANFDSAKARLATFMGGVTYKFRNIKYVQPSVKVMGGLALESITRRNILRPESTSGAFSVGGGLDFNLQNHNVVGFHLGADYLNTGFNGIRQNAVRFTTGVIF